MKIRAIFSLVDVSFYSKLRYNVKYWLILLRAKYKKNSASGFYFPPSLIILGAIFDEKQNNAVQQLIFKRSDFSEIFTRGNYMLEDSFKVPISSKFLFSYMILSLTQWTSAKEKFDLDKMQSFLEVLKTFKFAAILVHHSHQSSLIFEWVVT